MKCEVKRKMWIVTIVAETKITHSKLKNNEFSNGSNGTNSIAISCIIIMAEGRRLSTV